MLSVTSVCACLLLGLAATPAPAEEATAEQLFEQGMRHFEAGEQAEAKMAFNSLDPAALSSEQRTRMWKTIQAIDEQLSGGARDPGSLLEAAAAAQEERDLGRAADLYVQVARHEGASDEQRLLASTRLAEIRRALAPRLTHLRQHLDEAIGDYRAGRLEAAGSKLRKIKGTGIDLGWFDNRRVDRHLTLIAERQQMIAAVETAMPETPDAATEPAVVLEPEPAPEPIAVAAAPEPVTEAADWFGAPEHPVASVPEAPDMIERLRSLDAQRWAAAGREAEVNEQYHLAAENYQKALNLAPDHQDYQIALARVQDLARAEGLPADIVEPHMQREQLLKQKVIAEFENLVDRSTGQLEASRFPQALELVQQAKAVLDKNQHILATADYQQRRRRAVELDARIGREQRESDATTTKAVEEQNRIQEAMRREQDLLARDAETQELLAQARDFGAERRFEDALATINQALFRDPNNVAAQALRDMIVIHLNTHRARKIREQRAEDVVWHSNDNLESTLPPREILVYPADWPQITRMRKLAVGGDAEGSRVNREVELKLKKPIPVSFEANPLEMVIEFFRNTTGVNFYVNWSKLRDAGIDEDTPVTLKLTDTPAGDALQLVLRQLSTELDQLEHSVINGIVQISTRQDLRATTVTHSYDIRDLLIQAPHFRNAPEFDLNQALSNTSSGGSGTGTSSGGGSGGSSGGGGGGGSGNAISVFADSDSDTEEDLPSREEIVDNIMELIRDSVGDPDEWVDRGGQFSSLRELNGTLIVRTTPDQQIAVLELLSQLRETRAIQINVETRFLLVDQNFLEEVGADLDIRIRNVGNNWGPITISQDSFGITGRPSTGLPGGFLDTSGGAVAPDTGSGDDSNFQGGASTGRSLDVHLSYLDDLAVSLLIRATQATRRSIGLSAPRLTLMNGQRAFILVANQTTFISDVEPISDGVGFDPTLSVVSSGVVLEVEATVSADRRYVTLTTEPRLARVNQPIRRIPQTAFFDLDNVVGDNNQDGDGDEDQPFLLSSYIEAPEIELTEVRTTVSVPDKGTLLMGGMRLVGEIEVEAGVPVLSKIPWLSRLFTNRSSVKDERTLLILIKPIIIIQSEQENENFPGLLDNPDEYGSGMNY